MNCSTTKRREEAVNRCGGKVKGKRKKTVGKWYFRASSQNGCFVWLSTKHAVEIVDNVDNFVDNPKIKGKRAKNLWKTFVDNVDKILVSLWRDKPHGVELCKLYKLSEICVKSRKKRG